MGPGHLYREPQRGIRSQELFWASSPSSPAFPRGFAGEPETTQGTANMEAPRVLVGKSPVPLRSRCLLPGSWLENRTFPLQSRCRPLVETGAKVMPELQARKYGESLGKKMEKQKNGSGQNKQGPGSHAQLFHPVVYPQDSPLSPVHAHLCVPGVHALPSAEWFFVF